MLCATLKICHHHSKEERLVFFLFVLFFSADFLYFILNVTCDYSQCVMLNPFVTWTIWPYCAQWRMNSSEKNHCYVIIQMLALLYCVIHSSLIPSFWWLLEILGITWLVAESLWLLPVFTCLSSVCVCTCVFTRPSYKHTIIGCWQSPLYYNLTSTELHLQRPCIQMKSPVGILQGCEFWGDTHRSSALTFHGTMDPFSCPDPPISAS